jgi:hypothetical protein
MSNVIANTAIAREKQNAFQRANEFRRLAQSGVDITTPEGFNQLSGLDPEGAAALRKSALETRAADAKYKLDYLGSVREEIGRARNAEDAIAIGDMLKQTFPDFSGNIDQTLQSMPSDPAQFNQWRSSVDMSALKSSERVKYDYDEVTTELATGANGQPLVVTRGGLNAPTIVTPKSFVPGPQTPVKKEVELGEPFNVGGVGGPMEPAPMGAGGNDVAGVASVLSNVSNDAEYQSVLKAIDLQNPQMAASIRQAMPRFDPQRMAGIRNEAKAAFGGAGAPDQPGLVSGDRGVGGPYEGYVEAPTPFRLRVPASPVGPQPRETAQEVYDKEKARLKAQSEAGPKPLTAPQEAKLRSNIAKDYKSARSTIEMMDDVARAVNDVRNLSLDQKEAITGLSGYTYSILPSSRSADTKLANLKGKVTQMGKAAATLTGAIGQMAVQEWRIVSDMIASLDVTGMEPGDLDNQLDIIEGQARRAASITRDAYENQYVEDFARYPGRFQLPEAGGTASQGAPKAGQKYPVLTPDQVRKAPKGTTFRTTDGRLMRKN